MDDQLKTVYGPPPPDQESLSIDDDEDQDGFSDGR